MKSISVIIPSYNEAEETLRRTMKSLEHDMVHEVIIVDRGDKRPSAAFFDEHPKVVYLRGSEQSRAVQLNEGAISSACDYLLFIHADTVLSASCIDEALGIIAEEGVKAVSFGLIFDSDKTVYRLLEYGVALRNFLFCIPYGDQCYFIKKRDYLMLEGFDEIPILEDVKFVEKIKKAGKLKIASSYVTTSARRHEKNGAIKTSLRHYYIMILYYLGFDPERLAKKRK